ncbi:MAG: HAMP domain-containing sensor histidine kinase [Balneolaceae bacterium]
MQLFLPANRIKIVLIVMLILLAAVSYIYNRHLINNIRQLESTSVELWAKAIQFESLPVHDEISNNLTDAIQILQQIPGVPDSVLTLINRAEASKSSVDFVREELIINQQFQIPQLVVDGQGEIVTWNFIDDEDISPELISYLASVHDPIQMSFGDGELQMTQYVYFGESQMVQYLRFFPYIQFGILALLLGIGYMTYRSITRSEQSNLWVGMAKEAAHQLGTPISSLYGWIELLKEKRGGDGETSEIVREIENDIARLRGIAERFNKIGSEPELKSHRIVPIIDQVILYTERRLPQLGKKVELRRSVTTDARVNVNPELFQWAIENLLKNAMDAIRENSDKPYVSVSVNQLEDELIIDIEDSGTGIDKKYLTEIFKPGFSTKKRGWGLGLSLTKRIIEDYHKGNISVLRSEPDKGTTVRITLSV